MELSNLDSMIIRPDDGLLMRRSSSRAPSSPASSPRSVIHNSNDKQHGRSGSWILRASTREDRQILLRAAINILGAILFFIGSLGWVLNFPLIGTFIFAGSNVFCYCVTGVWWSRSAKKAFRTKYEDVTFALVTLSTPENGNGLPMHPGGIQTPMSDMPQLDSPDIVRAFRVLTHMEMMAAFWQIAGGIAFTIGCFTSLYPILAIETILFWLTGSFFFVIQAIISQIICESFWGPLLPLFPRYPKAIRQQLKRPYNCCSAHRLCLHRCIPGAMLNWLGSVLFTIASVCLFYPSLEFLGGWGYLIGSGFFVIAAYADIVGFLDALAARLIAHQQQNEFTY